MIYNIKLTPDQRELILKALQSHKATNNYGLSSIQKKLVEEIEIQFAITLPDQILVK